MNGSTHHLEVIEHIAAMGGNYQEKALSLYDYIALGRDRRPRSCDRMEGMNGVQLLGVSGIKRRPA